MAIAEGRPAVLRSIYGQRDQIMADEEIPKDIDLHDIASQNAKILSQLAALRLRLDVTLLASEQINAKLSALLEIQKSAAPQREMTTADTIPAPPLIDDFHAGDDLFGETETWAGRHHEPHRN
ncbi:MAG: hypothetical protein WBX25_12290 [Rhodomicrobium sp.]